jgi:prolyl 4-hydroxylase
MRLILLLLSLLSLKVAFAHAHAASSGQLPVDIESDYGLDVSFPIQRRVSTNYPWLAHNLDKTVPIPDKHKNAPLQPLGDRRSAYLHHLKGCRDEFGQLCDAFEYDRMVMNQRQPQSMTNYTTVGFKKIKAPQKVTSLISNFWKQNQYRGERENWPEGSVYVNFWETPTTLISVDGKGLRGSGPELKQEIWASALALLEEWTEQELQPCSMYGIRVYGEGAVMLPHVDRLPLVASAMIPVAHDTDEDWITEMYDHDGKAHNVTMEPGDMLLFESHSVIHGHPFPLKGRYYALLFIHFEPTGRSITKNATGYHYDDTIKEIDLRYKKNIQQGVGGQSSSGDGSLPPYITRQSPEEENWRRAHPGGWEPPPEYLPSEAHLAAKTGNLTQLEQELNEQVLHARDERGWQVLHQGVLSGALEVVKLLVNRGAEINARTLGGYGETPLRIAKEQLGESHPIVQYLEEHGALSLGPEL